MTDWMKMTINENVKRKSDHGNVSNKWIKYFFTTLLFRYITYVTEWCINWNKTQYKLRSESREFHVFSPLRWETLMSRSIRSVHALHRPISERYTVRGRGEYLRISPEDGLVVPRLSYFCRRTEDRGARSDNGGAITMKVDMVQNARACKTWCEYLQKKIWACVHTFTLV